MRSSTSTLGDMDRRVVEKADVGATPAATMSRSQARVSPVDRVAASGGAGPWVDALHPGRGDHPPLLHPALNHAAGFGGHHARHQAVAHFHDGKLNPAWPGFHDDAADKAGPNCSSTAPRAARAAMARASSSVQQVCTWGRSMPGMGGRTDASRWRSAEGHSAEVAVVEQHLAFVGVERDRAAAQLADAQARSKWPGPLRKPGARFVDIASSR